MLKTPERSQEHQYVVKAMHAVDLVELNSGQ